MARLAKPALVAFALCSGGDAGAGIIANFADGNSTTEVDGYTGMAGGGWVAGWTTRTIGLGSGTGNAPANPSIALDNSSPFTLGGGNYLVSSGQSISGLGAGMKFGRKYEAHEDVSLTGSQRISFQFRMEAPLENGAGTISIWDGNAFGSQILSSTNSTWSFRVANQAGLTNPTIQLFDGKPSGTTTVRTDFELLLDQVYTFTIDVFPAQQTWKFSVTGGTQTAYHSAELNFQSKVSEVGAYLNFATLFNASADPENPATIAYSVDNLAITAIPEPGAVGLLLMSGAAILALKRRTR